MKRAVRSSRSPERRPWSTFSIAIAGLALFIALSGTAVAATGLIKSKDIAKGAVTSKKIANGAVMPWDLNRSTRMWVKATSGDPGAKGDVGSTGSAGPAGAKGDVGSAGAPGSDGIDGTNGVPGDDGTPGVHGTDGIIAPLSTTAGLTQLPTATPPTVVVSLTVPAGNYVVWAKTQLSHTGAGDSVDCVLKAGATPIDQASMKTLPALAAIPVSLQAVTTSSPSQLSLECDVLTANGSANFSSLIAIPIG